MKNPLIKKLDLPKLLNTALLLEPIGKLALSPNKLLYLDIDDAYVHQLFPLLNSTAIQKPNYFGKGSTGAHISVIYPEERAFLFKEELNKEHQFKIKEAVIAEIGLKKYYVLIVQSPSLLEIRRRHGLSDLLDFKGYAIDLHITLGVFDENK